MYNFGAKTIHMAILSSSAAIIPFNQLPLLPPPPEYWESTEVYRALAAAEGALGELRGYCLTLPNPQLLLDTLLLQEAKDSSEIENIVTTHDELYKAVSLFELPRSEAVKEVLRYRSAMLKGVEWLAKQDSIITTRMICEIQAIIEDNNAGIRTLPGTALKTSVTQKVIYTPPDGEDVIRQLLANYETYINGTDDQSPALIKLAIQHYQFEAIHPFYDGNGRTGRILNILLLLKYGLLAGPVLYLSRYISLNKASYYRGLHDVTFAGEWSGWIIYMLTALAATAKGTTQQISKITAVMNSVRAQVRQATRSPQRDELVDLIFRKVYCRISDVESELNVSRMTATKMLKDLGHSGILHEIKVGRHNLYLNPQLQATLTVPVLMT